MFTMLSPQLSDADSLTMLRENMMFDLMNDHVLIFGKWLLEAEKTVREKVVKTEDPGNSTALWSSAL